MPFDSADFVVTSPAVAWCERIEELLSRRGGWCQGTQRFSRLSQSTQVFSYCLVGAFHEAQPKDRRQLGVVDCMFQDELGKVVIGALRTGTGDEIIERWNDRPSRRKGQVLAAVRRAKAALMAAETEAIADD